MPPQLKFLDSPLIIKVTTLLFAKMRSFILKKKNYTLVQSCLVSILFKWNLKKVFSCLKSASSNLSKCKVLCKTKKHRVLDQKCLLWKLLDHNLTILLSYLKSEPSNLLKCKVCWKRKKNGNKIVLFAYFWTGIWKS